MHVVWKKSVWACACVCAHAWVCACMTVNVSKCEGELIMFSSTTDLMTFLCAFSMHVLFWTLHSPIFYISCFLILCMSCVRAFCACSVGIFVLTLACHHLAFPFAPHFYPVCLRAWILAWREGTVMSGMWGGGPGEGANVSQPVGSRGSALLCI